MADYKKRLNNLRARRLGTDRSLNAFTKGFDSASFSDSIAFKQEAYEGRTQKEALKYVLGSMQQVDDDFTRISFEEGDRVKNHLDKSLNTSRISATFEYQGSVPMNIHIRGYSDIDLLVISNDFLTYDASGPRASDYVSLGGSAVDGAQLRHRFPCLEHGCRTVASTQLPRSIIAVSSARASQLLDQQPGGQCTPTNA